MCFRLGKGGTILSKSDGFSLSEVIIAMGILLMLVATVLPIHQKVTTDEHRIKHHQLIKLALHNELQAYILTDKTLDSYKSQVAKKDVQMSFTMEDEYVKGCATWENALKEKEKSCLYGIRE